MSSKHLIQLGACALLLAATACSQNEYSDKGPDPAAPKNPRPAERLAKGEEPAGGEGLPQSRQAEGQYSGTVAGPPGWSLPAGGTLFLIARDSGGTSSTPLAAKRLPVSSLPIAFEIGPADGMSGQPLPASLEILARLDSDGDMATVGPGDLSGGPVQARAGQPATIHLSPLPSKPAKVPPVPKAP